MEDKGIDLCSFGCIIHYLYSQRTVGRLEYRFGEWEIHIVNRCLVYVFV